MRYHPLRWIAFSVFVLSTTLNYLDRTLLNILAPLVMAEMHFNQIQFGWVLSVFSILYAASSLMAGWFLDKVGINRAITAAVAWWSAAAVGTGLVSSFSGLLLCRSALGIGESAGVPAVGKLNGIYLKPEERAIGTAVNGIAISLSSIIAPLWMRTAVNLGWRTPIVITGFLGFLWIPLWWFVNRSILPFPGTFLRKNNKGQSGFHLLSERPLILLMLANAMWMGSYSLWSNWTTLYLVHVHHLALQDTAVLIWIPPVVSNVGGFFGGWLSMRWIKRNVNPTTARLRAVWLSAAGSLSVFALLLAPNALWATAVISLSFFFVLSGSVNIYALPIDMYGAENAGFTVSTLTFAFGVLQAIISPMIGWFGDHGLYRQVVWLVTIPAFLSSIALLGCRPKKQNSAPS